MSYQTIWLLAWLIFIIGYAVIALEHKLRVNKSGTAIIIGVILWIIIVIYDKGSEDISLALNHETEEIFGIVVFLLAAMTLVETLSYYRFFDWVQEKIMQKKISQIKFFWLLGALIFIFSAFLDNLTTTLIMLQVGRKIYKNRENF